MYLFFVVIAFLYEKWQNIQPIFSNINLFFFLFSQLQVKTPRETGIVLLYLTLSSYSQVLCSFINSERYFRKAFSILMLDILQKIQEGHETSIRALVSKVTTERLALQARKQRFLHMPDRMHLGIWQVGNYLVFLSFPKSW